jgi:hypothetical protein
MTINQILKQGFNDILDAGDCSFSKNTVLEMIEQLTNLGVDIEEGEE